MSPAASRAPKNALSPASILAPDAQMGLPATSPVSTPVSAAATYASAAPPAPAANVAMVQPCHERGRHEPPDDEPEHQAEEKATQHQVLTAWPCRGADVNDDRLMRRQLREPRGQPGAPVFAPALGERELERARIAHEHDEALSAGHRRVEQVLREHDEVRGEERARPTAGYSLPWDLCTVHA